MSTSDEPIEALLSEIEGALEVRLWQLALFGTLTVPDICAALESPDGQTTGAKYRAWFDHYVAPKYVSSRGDVLVSGAVAYKYRCRMLHQGSGQLSGPVTRILFVDPTHPSFMHMNQMNDLINLDLGTFCADVIAAARRWLQQVAGAEPYVTNSEQMFKRHAGGLPPFISGADVFS